MTQSLELLDGQQYISLTTFRKNGEAKSTPVWFAQANGKLFVFTELESWKVKRIQNNPQVQIAPCKSNGSLIGDVKWNGSARIMSAAEEETAKQAFKSKYGFMKSLFNLLGKVRRKQRIYLELTLQAEV